MNDNFEMMQSFRSIASAFQMLSNNPEFAAKFYMAGGSELLTDTAKLALEVRALCLKYAIQQGIV